MNKRQKEAALSQLKDEQAAVAALEKAFEQARKDVEKAIAALEDRKDLQNIESIVHQLKYQKAIRAQIDAALEGLHEKEYATVAEYLDNCYWTGYSATMYDLHGQGIPIVAPIDQALMAKAVTIDAPLSKPLYDHLGEDLEKMKERTCDSVTRAIAQGKTWTEAGVYIAQGMNNPYKKSINYAVRIARTEGHRIQIASTFDAQATAKERGADVVKQWDSTLDGKTRPTHRKLDGQTRELDEDFEVQGHKARGPGHFGRPEEDINCRCALLTIPRWALDDEMLDELKQRAEYFGLDKTKDFEDFKNKYSAAAKAAQKAELDALDAMLKVDEPTKPKKPADFDPDNPLGYKYAKGQKVKETMFGSDYEVVEDKGDWVTVVDPTDGFTMDMKKENIVPAGPKPKKPAPKKKAETFEKGDKVLYKGKEWTVESIYDDGELLLDDGTMVTFTKKSKVTKKAAEKQAWDPDNPKAYKYKKGDKVENLELGPNHEYTVVEDLGDQLKLKTSYGMELTFDKADFKPKSALSAPKPKATPPKDQVWDKNNPHAYVYKKGEKVTDDALESIEYTVVEDLGDKVVVKVDGVGAEFTKNKAWTKPKSAWAAEKPKKASTGQKFKQGEIVEDADIAGQQYKVLQDLGDELKVVDLEDGKEYTWPTEYFKKAPKKAPKKQTFDPGYPEKYTYKKGEKVLTTDADGNEVEAEVIQELSGGWVAVKHPDGSIIDEEKDYLKPASYKPKKTTKKTFDPNNPQGYKYKKNQKVLVHEDGAPTGKVLEDDGAMVHVDFGNGDTDWFPKSQLEPLVAKKASKKTASSTINPDGLTPSQIASSAKDFKGRTEADAWHFPNASKAWRTFTNDEKEALYRYTGSAYDAINGALRGRDPSPGSTTRNRIKHATKALEKTSLPEAVTVRRGTGLRSMANVLGISKDELQDPSNWPKLVGRAGHDDGFMSTGVSASTGFTKSVNLVLHLPKGTKGMYVEPFSMHGAGHVGDAWDGVTHNQMVGGEAEYLLQRGTDIEVLRIWQEPGSSTINVEAVVTGQTDWSADPGKF